MSTKTSAKSITTLSLSSAKKGVVIQQAGKRKKWVITFAGFVERGFKDKHFEIEMVDYKEVQEKLPNPASQTIGIIGVGSIFERTLNNPHNISSFQIIEKRKIKKSVVKIEIYSPKIRKNIYSESDRYIFVD